MSEKIEVSETGIHIHDLEIENEDLAQYLAGFEEPEVAFEELVDIALRVKSQFTTDLETQNIREAADDVSTRMDELFEQLVEELQEKAALLVDPENGPVIKALDRATGDNLKKLLAPEDTLDQSPIARLRGMILQELNTFKEVMDKDLGAIKSKLGIDVQKRKTAADGADFESKIDGVIQSYALVYGDTAIATGAITEGSASKKGDTEVEINFADTNGISCKIIWESKTDARFKGKSTTQSPKVIDDQVRKELNDAIETRKAKSAIMVLDSSGLDMEAQPTWREYEGNKLLIVVDTLMPDEDLIRLAYIWGRWKAKASIGSMAATVDYDGIKNGFEQLRLRLQDLRNVKKTNTDVINMLTGSSALVNNIQKDTKRMMQDLAETIDIEFEAGPEDDLSDES